MDAVKEAAEKHGGPTVPEADHPETETKQLDLPIPQRETDERLGERAGGEPVAKKAAKKAAPPTEPAPAPEPQVEPAPVKCEPVKAEYGTQPAQYDGEYVVADGFSGEFDESDVGFPSLKIVQAVGPASENFTPGSILLNNDEIIGDQNHQVEFIVLYAEKSFEEYVEYGSGVSPRIFKTRGEVLEADGTTEWRDNQRPSFSPILTTYVAVAKPAGVQSDLFEYEVGNGAFCVAQWRLKSTAYTSAAKPILNAWRFYCRASGKHLAHIRWSLAPKRELRGDNYVWVPRVSRIGKHDEKPYKALIGA